MAQTLNLYKSYVDGQGVGASSYIQYTQHLDADHTAIETSVNQLVSEVTGLKGPNTLLGLDLAQINDAAGPYGARLEGVLGQHSLRVVINGGDPTRLDVAAGQAIVSNLRVAIGSGIALYGSGGAGTRWVAITQGGTISLETAAGAKDLDVASVAWNGAQFTGSVTQLAEIFADGDDSNLALDRAAVGGATKTFPATDFRSLANRLAEIERLLAAIKTPLEGATNLGPIAFGGAAGTPGLVLSDGSTYDLTTGLFRAATNVLGIAISGTELLRCLATALRANADGSNAAPFWSWVTDPDSGLYRIAANRIGLATNALLGFELSDYQQPTSPTAFRFRVTTTDDTLSSSATPSAIEMDTEVTDVGGWGAAPSESWTVPTGGAGFYVLTGHLYFDESTSATPNVGTVRRAQLEVAGTVLADALVEPQDTANEDTSLVVAALAQLAAGQAVRLFGAQDSGNDMTVDGHLAACRLW